MCSIMVYCGRHAKRDKFEEGFARTISRGPDESRIIEFPVGLMGFHRLAIMGLTPEGMQPFQHKRNCLVCRMRKMQPMQT